MAFLFVSLNYTNGDSIIDKSIVDESIIREEEIMSLEEISHLLYQIKLADQKIVQIFEENIGISLTI